MNGLGFQHVPDVYWNKRSHQAGVAIYLFIENEQGTGEVLLGIFSMTTVAW